MKKQRLINFERIDPEYVEIGFYMGGHHCDSFSKEENEEFDKCMMDLFGPYMNNYRDFKFFFTKNGFRKHRKLIGYLIRATNPKYKIAIQKVWKQDFDIAYEDKEQVAILSGPKRKIRKRKVQIKKANKIYNSPIPRCYSIVANGDDTIWVTNYKTNCITKIKNGVQEKIKVG